MDILDSDRSEEIIDFTLMCFFFLVCVHENSFNNEQIVSCSKSIESECRSNFRGAKFQNS